MEAVTCRSRLKSVQERIGAACESARRSVTEITLVAVSKHQPAEAIAALADLGVRDFGENYVQEALGKQEALDDLELQWHFIGRLQSNKARFVVGRFSLIHVLDSAKLAHCLHNISQKMAQERAFRQDVLIQVNLGREPQKSGVMPEDLQSLAEETLSLSGLRLLGLMCLPPLFEGPDASRPYFARLRELRDELARKLGVQLPHLSMGMSIDFEAAIEEGATIIRVGTDLFGERLSRI